MLAFGGVPMKFPSSRYVTRAREFDFHLCLRTCLLTALLAGCLPLATAQTETPDGPSEHPSAESRKTDSVAGKNANKPDKYDVDHIGQRGIGRGFNIYSAKRERELGQSLAASFDRTSRISNDTVVNDYVNRVAQKVVRYSDAEVPFTVKVIDSGDIPRAYGLPMRRPNSPASSHTRSHTWPLATPRAPSHENIYITL
jgi:hypothetical protein